MLFFYYFTPRRLDDRSDACVIWKNWRLLGGKELYDISKDRMQEHDVAAEFPEVVEKMNAEFDAYHARGLELIKQPVRIILGDARAPRVELTSQDVYSVPKAGRQSFSQGDALNLTQSYGPYAVTLARNGRYTFTPSRYPLYTEIPFGVGGRKFEEDFSIDSVRMSIAGQKVQKSVTPEDTHASFTLELEVGDADLETALIVDGKDGVAYLVTVQYDGP